MIFYLLLCYILIIPLVYSTESTVNKPDLANKTLYEFNKSLRNDTKVTLISEGGTLLPETPVLALPNENHTIVMSLDSDIDSGKNKVKPVVARKGVVYVEENSVKPQQNIPSTSNNNSTVTYKAPDKLNVLSNKQNSTSNIIVSKVNNTLLNKITNGVKELNKTVIHKPLILSYDAVANMTVKTSSETLIYDQIQTPKKNVKSYIKSANSHPGIIMPLVITILLVPMFAVLGYMALRRGQEAWKNRHYKRMDFLLDGMYND